MPDPAIAVSKARVAIKSFRFQTSLVLQESTGLRASTLPLLVKLLRSVPDASIYYHTHYFLLQHNYLTPEPTNDLAYWVTHVLGEVRLGEQLASIDTMAHVNLTTLREELATTIEQYLETSPTSHLRFVAEGEEFFFMKAVHIILPTPYTASTLLEFAQGLERVSIGSLYFHIFDARLRLGQPTNDFAQWFTEQLGLSRLAEIVAKLDPYSYSLEMLRSTLLTLMREELQLL